MNIPILYEDDEVVAIDKPVGLVVHPDGRTKEQTLVEWVCTHYPQIATDEVGESIVLTGGGEIRKPGIVHRIDRNTSGVLLIAKSHASFENLKAQFHDRTIKKHYNAIVLGHFKESQGVVEKPIGRSASDFRKWSAEYGARGELREARTEYQVLGQGSVPFLNEKKKEEHLNLSYLDVFPRTGRTHQIRVHLKAVGHPILCDKLYAPKMPCILGFQRIALHAASITFQNLRGEEKMVEAPLPEDFRRGIAELGLM